MFFSYKETTMQHDFNVNKQNLIWQQTTKIEILTCFTLSHWLYCKEWRVIVYKTWAFVGIIFLGPLIPLLVFLKKTSVSTALTSSNVRTTWSVLTKSSKSKHFGSTYTNEKWARVQVQNHTVFWGKPSENLFSMIKEMCNKNMS